jgi:hypothetical protein
MWKASRGALQANGADAIIATVTTAFA